MLEKRNKKAKNIQIHNHNREATFTALALSASDLSNALICLLYHFTVFGAAVAVVAVAVSRSRTQRSRAVGMRLGAAFNLNRNGGTQLSQKVVFRQTASKNSIFIEL